MVGREPLAARNGAVDFSMRPVSASMRRELGIDLVQMSPSKRRGGLRTCP